MNLLNLFAKEIILFNEIAGYTISEYNAFN